MSYNTNCLFTDKNLPADPTDTTSYLSQQDVLLLQELGSIKAPINAQRLLHTHTLWHSTHARWGKGRGVAIAIHNRLTDHYHTHKIYDEYQITHLQLKDMLPGTSDIVHIIGCYFPHGKSKQLDDVDMLTRYSQLAQIIDNITASKPGSLVIVAGDINAKVGTDLALSSQALQAVDIHNQASPGLSIRPYRQQLHPDLDHPGTLLNDMCEASHMINLTGLTDSDCPAAASFISITDKGRTQHRLDHVLVSPSALPFLQHHSVVRHVRGSDHLPVAVTLGLKLTPPQTQHELPIDWQQVIPSTNREVVQRYITSLSELTAFDSIKALASTGEATAEQLLIAFNTTITRAAQDAGYRTRSMAQQPQPAAPRTQSKHKVWFDHICKQLQHEIRTLAATADPSTESQLQGLIRRYKQRVKALVRKHRAAHARQQAQAWRKDRNSFWRWYRPNGTHCPFSPHKIAEHFKQKLNGFAGAPAQQQQPTPPAQPASQLGDVTSQAPTAADICAAIASMRSTAAGADGIPVALLRPSLPPPPPAAGTQSDAADEPPATAKSAISNIAAALQLVYDAVGKDRQVPKQWSTALLMPIYKGKGQLSNLESYRPLSVPPVTCRLWSSIINRKLMAAAKDILPDTMFGFRPHRRTSDPLFILRHMFDMQKADKGDRFAVAFMDLSGAYDSIDRHLLFSKLEQLGMSPDSVAVLRSLYEDTQCIVKCERGTHAPFSISMGLRQGCPLSTTLFNLYIWDLHLTLRLKHPTAGVTMHSTPERTAQLISDLAYADDIALCGSSPDALQHTIDTFHAYCCKHGLIVNPSKCEVVVFSKRCTAWAKTKWHIGGAALPRAEKFKYLGVELHGTKGIKAAVEHRLSRMFAAQSSVNRRLSELQAPRDPSLIADLFDSITAASGSFGCEVWATPYLDSWHLRDCTPIRFQASIYKQALGVARSTSNELVFFEMGRYPLQIQWLQRTISYWNNLVTNAAGSELMAACLEANLHYGLREDAACWSQELLRGLTFVAPEHDWKDHMLQKRPIDSIKSIVALAKVNFTSSILQYDQDPTAPDCPHRYHHSYTHWMYSQPVDGMMQAPAYIAYAMPLRQKRDVARCRLSGAPVRTTRKHDKPYLERSCERCTMGCVDTEEHLLLSCAHTSLQHVRSDHHPVLNGVEDLRSLMDMAYDQERVVLLADYISEVFSVVQEG